MPLSPDFLLTLFMGVSENELSPLHHAPEPVVDLLGQPNTPSPSTDKCDDLGWKKIFF